MRKSLALIPAMLLLASCGANAEEPQTEPTSPETVAPEPTFVAPEPISLDDPQTFEYTTLDGAKGVLTIPAAPEPAFHEFLTLTGQDDDKTYAVVDVDNRKGMAEYGVYDVNLYTPEGDVVTFSNLNHSMSDQGIEVPDDELDAYYSLPGYMGTSQLGSAPTTTSSRTKSSPPRSSV